MQFVHPDDLDKLVTISSTLTDSLKNLTGSEILQCRLSYDYRLRFFNNRYHWIQQHSFPLSFDPSKRIMYALLVLCDISLFKRAGSCQYQAVHYGNNNNRRVLAEGAVIHPLADDITPREREVIELTSRGFTEAEIARKLEVGIQTIKTHRKNLFQKTGTKNSIELVKFSLANLII